MPKGKFANRVHPNFSMIDMPWARATILNFRVMEVLPGWASTLRCWMEGKSGRNYNRGGTTRGLEQLVWTDVNILHPFWIPA